MDVILTSFALEKQPSWTNCYLSNMKSLVFLLLLLPAFVCRAQEIPRSHSRFYALTENKGQWAPQVLFQSRSQGQNIWVQQHGFIYDLRDHSALHEAHDHPNAVQGGALTVPNDAISVHFLESKEVTNIVKEIPSKHYYNYFLGNNKDKWVSNVRTFQEATLHDFYEGIDLKLFDKDGTFKYELWCSPDADLKQIAIRYKNAQSLHVDENGNLIIATKLGEIKEQAPIAYELYKGSLSKLTCSFHLSGDTVRFELGRYREGATVIIDPVLVFATYSGAQSDNFGMTATYGYDGSAYSAGTVFGNLYPTPDPAAWDVTTSINVPDTGTETTDVFVSKYSADGSTMLWTNFLGGGDNTVGTETAHSLICDKQNNVYLFGVTSSLDFPIQGGYQDTLQGGTANVIFSTNGTDFRPTGTDIYVAKFSANGENLLGSTYIGGSLDDGVNFNLSNSYDSLTNNYGDQFRGEIMIDSLGNCIIATCTWSTDFPTLNPYQAANAGRLDAVVFSLNSSLSNLNWSTYFGGLDYDAAYSVKIDSSYNIVFSGGTISDSLPGTTGAYLTSFQGGKADGFVAKLTPNGQNLIRTSFIGTSDYDQAYFVEINRNDEVFLYGQSRGAFPTVNATSYPNNGQYIIKLTPGLDVNMNSFTFGSSGAVPISPSAFLVDICGNMYVSGWGGNVLAGPGISGLPTTTDAFRPNPPDGYDFYLGVFERDFDGLLYGTYMGSPSSREHVDGGTSRFDKNGVVYQSVCGGCGGDSEFPTTVNAWSTENLNNTNNNCNNIVFKFDFQLIPNAVFLTSDSTVCAGFPITFDNFSSASDSYLWDFGNGDTTSIIFNPVVTYSTPGSFEVLLTVTDSICLLTDTARITVDVLPALQLDVDNDTISCVFNPFILTANSFGTADTFIWSSNEDFTDTLNTSVSDSTLLLSYPLSATYYVMESNPGCRKIDSVHVYIVEGAMVLSGDTVICQGTNTLLTANIDIPGITFDYVWSPANMITPTSADNQVYAQPTQDQWIVVSAIGSNGCNDVDSIFIDVIGIFPNVNATADPTFVLPDSLTTLTATPNMPGLSYAWSPTEGVYSPTSPVTQARILETTTFTVSVSDGVCIKNDTVTVFTLDYVCDDPFIYVPNAFTPNGDGENDKLYVRTVVASTFLFRVYDRWGELVFESRDRLTGWDGTFRNKQLDPDVYDYYLQATCVNGMETIKKGNITLIR